MDQKLGSVKRYFNCKKSFILDIVISTVLGTMFIYAFIWEQKHGFGYSFFSVVSLLIALLFFCFVAHYFVLSLRCKLYVYENGIVFSMPTAPFTVKTRTILFDEVIGAEYKSRVPRFRSETLIIHAVSGDYALRYFPSAELNTLYDFLRWRGSAEDGD